MKKINLLPHKVQKSKDVRRFTIIIAAVQAVIFLTVVVLYLFFSMWQARLESEVHSLIRFRAEDPVQHAGAGVRHHFFHDSFLEKDALISAQAVPDGIWLVELNFSHGEFSITAAAYDILKIQTHMELLDEYFYGIRLTNLTAADGGYYVYELNFSTR